MLPRARHLGAALAVLSAALVAVTYSNAPRAAAATEITELREGPGRDLTVGRCIICHSVEYIPANAPAMDRAAWQKSIQKMKERFGAPITDEEAKQILDYLSANYSGKSG
jgi:mono/diheme cytochrome c family protein